MFEFTEYGEWAWSLKRKVIAFLAKAKYFARYIHFKELIETDFTSMA